MANAYEHDLIFSIALSAEFGTDDERDAIRRAEEQIAEILDASAAGLLDGDEFGDGVCRIFCFVSDAEEALRALAPVIAAHACLQRASISNGIDDA